MPIQSFACRRTQALFEGQRVARWHRIEAVALRKLAMLNVAVDLRDLRIPPANRLESLLGDRQGQYSIRINDQFRMCFVWTREGPAEVEIIDYH
ncbi:type II toxin-antitoxin system RelE/ParE family toxin [Stenotrophomonas sp. NA06056]|jgi:proteic killer suppression protein|uniref:type II toxin-antitoxin system RelE/ParE family toxin n=1 Tax=Stenotrophomonas sp. NA06056 TaxID=2742129 RepID=UPI00158B9EFF|nr:type II toxin-antitoxin system RelE/ParE family toxin [Stenotrophomonas sp. NA06056]QKW55185.1 type II toxin-antitoxin system RelE/ParE family toxin [Stenotrophomonas sp. NA06056]